MTLTKLKTEISNLRDLVEKSRQWFRHKLLLPY